MYHLSLHMKYEEMDIENVDQENVLLSVFVLGLEILEHVCSPRERNQCRKNPEDSGETVGN